MRGSNIVMTTMIVSTLTTFAQSAYTLIHTLLSQALELQRSRLQTSEAL